MNLLPPKKTESFWFLSSPCLCTRASSPSLGGIAIPLCFREQSNPSSPELRDPLPLDWAHPLPHRISFPSPSLPVQVLCRKLRGSELLSGFAANFWVEQPMSSLGLHGPVGYGVPLRKEQLRRFNLCERLETGECSAALETMCNWANCPFQK